MNVKTKILNSKNSKHIKLAVKILKEKRLVAFPTETVYGLGAISTSESSILNIFKVKNRPLNNPLIMHVTSVDQVLKIFDINHKNIDKQIILNRLLKLSKDYWPGPLSIVSYKKQYISDIITGNLNKVAVRIPSNKVVFNIISLLKIPIVAPSANIFCRPSPTSVSHVLKTLNGKIDAVIDGGICFYGIESTVIDISSKNPRVLRLGVITIKEISKTLKEHVLYNSTLFNPDFFCSPGMLSKHYSPKIEHIVLCDKNKLKNAWINGSPVLLKKQSAILLKKKYGERLASSITEILPNTAYGIARELYASFYRLEEKNIKNLFVEKFFKDLSGAWGAIIDRILRAAS